MLTILPSSSTRAILLTSLAIYSCIPLESNQYYINIIWCISYVDFQKKTCSQNKDFRKSDRLLTDIQPSRFTKIYSVSISCPKALHHLESDNLFRITVVVADWLG